MFGRTRLDKSASKTGPGDFQSSGSELDRKFWVALALYAGLAAVAWFTMDAGKVLVAGKAVELRLIPLIILGGLALKTVLARQADRIRRGR